MNGLKRTLLLLPFALLCIGCSVSPHLVVPEHSHSNRKPETKHWGYEGVEGPEHWAMLDPSYMECETGREQSPINIVMPRHGEGQEELTLLKDYLVFL